MKLVAMGYGSLNEVKEMTAREVIQALSYEDFNNKYEQAYMELNREHS